MSESHDLMQNFPEHADRRIHSRHRIRALAYVELGENNGGIVLNLSEGGFAVRAAEAIHEDSLSRLRFQMQHATQPLEISGKIAWTSDSRKEAGVRFVDVPEETLLEIKTWILQEVSPGNSRKHLPFSRRAFSETPRENESMRDDTFSGDEIVESEPEESGDDQVIGPSVIAPSRSKVPAAVAPNAMTEKQQHGATLFPKPASPSLSAGLPVPALPATKGPERVSPARGAEKAPENWMDFRIQMGRGWMIAALVVFLVAVSFSAGMAVRRSGLAGLSPDADTASSAGAHIENSVPVAPSASAPSKPLQIEIVDSSNQRWTIPASVPAAHSAANAADIANGVSNNPSENIAPSSSGLSPAPAHQDAADASAAPGRNGTEPILLSLPERSVSASGSVAVSAQRSLVVSAESSQSTPQPGKNLQVGQLANLVDPEYPADAEQKHIEGTVRLHATIGADGSVKDLQALSGPPSLLPAALTAVREWRYNPTLLNGQPIETQEEISVVFRLPN
jgi:TonB family protein